jgi:hypothetical protein
LPATLFDHINQAIAVTIAFGWAGSFVLFGLAAIWPRRSLPAPQQADVLMEARAIVWAYARQRVG